MTRHTATGTADPLEARRREMVEHHLAARGIADRRVLEAMGRVRREAFLPAELEEFAYEDSPRLPAAAGQGVPTGLPETYPFGL